MFNPIPSKLNPSGRTPSWSNLPIPKTSDSEGAPDFDSDSSDLLYEYSSDDDDLPQSTEVTSRVHGVPCRCQVNEFGPIKLSNVVDERSERLMILNLGNHDIDPALYTTVKEEYVGKAAVSKNSNIFLNIEELQAYRQRTQTCFDNNDINVFTKDKRCFSISDYTLGNDTNGTAILSFEMEGIKQTLINEAIHCISLSRMQNMLALSCDSNGDNVYVSRRADRNGLIWDEATYLKVETDLTKFPESLRPTYAFPGLSLNLPSVKPPPLPSFNGTTPYKVAETIGTIQSLHPVYIVAETIITERSGGEIKGPLKLSWKSPSEDEDWTLTIKNDDGFEGDMTWKRENAQESKFENNTGMTLTELNRLAIIQALGATIQDTPFKSLDGPTRNAVLRLSLTMAIDRDSKKASPITNLDCDVENLLTQTLLERTRT